ncbi:MAG TPA: hypothetical protein VMB81_12130 [Candidatus Sulfotelmatobacter sp.]|nr:hypothetical protein [Candidatus Sulfotelmatobacter sp.]
MAGPDRRGLFKRLAEALFDDVLHRTPAAPDSVPEPAPPRSDKRREIAHAAFQGRIAELLEQGHLAVAGKLQFVDLEAIKAELGERWQVIADKVREVTQRTIERRLAPGDAYVAFDDDSYLLLFANLNEAQARIKATAIAMEIRQRMTGDFNLVERYWVRTFIADLANAANDRPVSDASSALAALSARLSATQELTTARAVSSEVPSWDQPARAVTAPQGWTPDQTAAAQARFESRVGEVARRLGRGATGKLQLLQLDNLHAEFGERWDAIADRVRTITEQVLRTWLAPIDVFAPLDDHAYLILFADLVEDEARLKVAAIAREIRDRLLGALGPLPEPTVEAFVAPVSAVVRSRIESPTMETINRALAEADDVAPARDTAAQAELRPRLGEVSVTYRPTLYTRSRMVSVFGAQAMRLAASGTILRGVAAYPTNDPPVAFEIDRAVLQRALKDGRRLVRRSERALVTVPLRLQSLIDHSAGQLVDLCRGQRPAVRRLIVIEIAGLLADAPTARLGEAIEAVRPFCRALTISVPPPFTEFERAARLGVTSIGIELGSSEAPMPSLTARLAGFAESAHAQGLTAHLHGIADPMLLEAAHAAGFDYLNGPAIAAEVVRPVAMYERAAPSDT